MSYLDVELHFQRDGAPEDFDDFIDSVLDELVKIGRSEVDVVASLTEYTAHFTARVDTENLDEVSDYLVALRTALHSAGCGTATWPGPVEFRNASSRQSDLASA